MDARMRSGIKATKQAPSGKGDGFRVRPFGSKAARQQEFGGADLFATYLQRKADQGEKAEKIPFLSQQAGRIHGLTVQRQSPAEKLTEAPSYNTNSETKHYLIGQEGGEDTPYVVNHGTPQLFWRGDSRGPAEVFKTGFTSKNERAGRVQTGQNQIIWREGGATDDILPASAVCLAKDVRGSAFFPLTGESTFYMYVIAKSETVSTYAAQIDKERKETGRDSVGDPRRYRYDPEYEDVEGASAVWQFEEHAVHRVTSDEILASFEVERRTLVPPYKNNWGDVDVAIAGIQFKLGHCTVNEALTKKRKDELSAVFGEALAVAAKYQNWYPDDEERFISYMGMVRPKESGKLPQKMEEAQNMMEQESALITVDGRFNPALYKAPTPSNPFASLTRLDLSGGTAVTEETVAALISALQSGSLPALRELTLPLASSVGQEQTQTLKKLVESVRIVDA